MDNQEVFIIYAGGTIGMKKTIEGYVPIPNYLSDFIHEMPEFRDPRMPRYTIKEYSPLLDSSSMEPKDWKQIATDIAENYDKYDGFVILHGTDTMAHTASALSFMLQNLGKTVVLTGAQIPLSEIRNDGRYNLISSVMIAGNFQIPEVCIFFDDHLLRGNRSKKVDIWNLRAFESYNYPTLAHVGVDINISANMVLPAPKGPFSVLTNMSEDIICVRMFPGLSPQVFQQMIGGPSIKGIVLEVVGAGNFPEKREYSEILEDVIKRGVVVVILSQVFKGSVNMDVYKAGSTLKKIGVISGYDMTFEAAVIKLQFLFGQGLSPSQVKAYMKRSLVGEFTPPEKPKGPGAVPDLRKSGEMVIWPFQFHSTMGYTSNNPPEVQHPPSHRGSVDLVDNNKSQG